MDNGDYINANYEVVGQGGIPWTANVRITQKAWAAADPDTQEQVTNILASTPIQLLPISGTGNGFKRESDGWTIHTQTNKRLYDQTNTGPAPKTFLFDKYRKPPH